MNHRGESEIELPPCKLFPLAHRVDEHVTDKDPHLYRVLEVMMAKWFGIPEQLLQPEEDFLGGAPSKGFSPSEKKDLCKEWAQGSLLSYSAKYNSVVRRSDQSMKPCFSTSIHH